MSIRRSHEGHLRQRPAQYDEYDQVPDQPVGDVALGQAVVQPARSLGDRDHNTTVAAGNTGGLGCAVPGGA